MKRNERRKPVPQIEHDDLDDFGPQNTYDADPRVVMAKEVVDTAKIMLRAYADEHKLDFDKLEAGYALGVITHPPYSLFDQFIALEHTSTPEYLNPLFTGALITLKWETSIPSLPQEVTTRLQHVKNIALIGPWTRAVHDKARDTLAEVRSWLIDFEKEDPMLRDITEYFDQHSSAFALWQQSRQGEGKPPLS